MDFNKLKELRQKYEINLIKDCN